MKQKTISVLEVAPRTHPHHIRIDASKQALRTAINKGADITGEIAAKKLATNVYAVFHSFRCFSGLEANRRLGTDIIAGTFYVVATDEMGNLRSLPTDIAKSYIAYFWNIEEIDDIEMITSNIDLMYEKHGESEPFDPMDIYYEDSR